jgi:ribonucleoside-diphosphate reductase alpha chain
MFLDDTACNLASINLTQLRIDDYPVINPELLRHIVRTSIYSQEALVDQSSYPSKEIAENSHKFRPLGLGYTNLGAFLMEMGVPYDSEEGRSIAAVVTSLMTAYAYQTSAEIASKVGTFEEYDKNREPMLEVIRMHADAAKKIIKNSKVKGLNDLIEESRKAWETVSQIGEQHGFRNAQVTLLAPTGTISFMMDADCTGIEPMIGLETTKGLAGGGEIKRSLALCVTKGLQSLGYNASQIEKIVEYVNEHKSVVGAPELDRDHYKVFETALGDEDPISVDGHLNMMAAVQPFLSGAISKTVNLPRGSTVQDIKDTYIKAWKLGLKSVCPYVDQSKGIQPVTVSSLRGNGKTEPKWGQRVKPTGVYGELGPIERFSFSVEIDRTPVHIIFGDYQNRPPKEAFADYFVAFGGSGSPLSAHVEDWAKAGSRSRQRGEPFDEFVRHNVGSVGTIRGFTNHPFIKTCTGIADFVAKLAALEYQANTDYCDVKPTSEQIEELRCNVLARRRREEHYRSRIRFIDHVMEKGEVMPIVPLYEDNIQPREIRMGQEFCIRCGSKTVLSGANCRRCENCGDAGACG